MDVLVDGEHIMTLSHIYGGYTRSEQPLQAPNQKYWCCLATPKRPLLNADAMFEFHPHVCNKGLLPTTLKDEKTETLT